MQQALKDLLNFPLAVYLCAFQDENVYLSYGMWYSIRQAVPCPTNPEDCQVTTSNVKPQQEESEVLLARLA